MASHFKLDKLNSKFLIKIITLIPLTIILCILSGYVYGNYLNKIKFETDVVSASEENANKLFTVSKVVLFSSANAEQHEVSKKAIWDLDISQYTDIAIYIDNQKENGVSARNTISSLTIDETSFVTAPELGTPSLYYKDIHQFGTFEKKEENRIENSSYSFNIINYNENIDYSKPSVYNDLGNPITLSYINSNIKEHAIISDTSSPLTFDGNLLKRANIPLSSIKTTLHLKLHLTTNMNEQYVCSMNIEIPLEDKENVEGSTSIYDGYLTKEIQDSNFYHFYKISS